MTRTILLATACLALLSATPQVQAGVISVTSTVTGFADASDPPNPFDISFTNLPTESVAGGMLTLTTFGDFNVSGEWIDILIDGVSFGRLWDNNVVNDSFAGTITDNDVGQQYGVGLSGSNPGATLTLSKPTLDGFLSDGIFTISFSFPIGVNNLSDINQEFITATLDFQSVDVPTVPEPTSLAVFAIGACVAGLGATHRRRLGKKTATE